MEFLSSMWSTTILPLIMAYGSTLLLSIVTALVLALVIGFLTLLSKLIKPLCDYFEALAEKHLSEKVSNRINDAINKLEAILIDIVVTQNTLIKKMAIEAYQNDGKIDMAEIKEIGKAVADIAIKRITPDVATFKKYLSGDAVFEYVQDKATAIITQSVESFLEKKLVGK
jgi:hypothetical protein